VTIPTNYEIASELATYLARAATSAHAVIIGYYQKWKSDERKALSRHDCMREGGWRESSQIAKENSGALFSFLDGRKRLIATESFYRHLIENVIRSHPAGGRAPRGTATSTRFARKGVSEGAVSEV
jgi:hypothetical protein